jgi:hypothetical protein
VRAFTGSSIPVLGSDMLVLLTRPFDSDVLIDRDGGGLASDAVGTSGVDSAGEVGAEARCGTNGGRFGSPAAHAFPASDTMVGVDGTQGNGVGVRALGLRLSDGRTHLRDGAGDGGFLGVSA